MGVHPVYEAITSEDVKTLFKIKSRQIIRRPEFSRDDPCDLQQELAVQVLRQARHFDPSRGSAKTFIARVVDSAVAMLLRDRRRLKRGAAVGAISLERTHADGHDPCTIKLSAVIHEEDLRRRCGGVVREDRQQAEIFGDVRSILEGFSEFHRQIAIRLADAPEAVVALEMGISRRQVRKAVESIRSAFERAGFANFENSGQSARGRHK